MKKLLSIILAIALLAVPFAITAMADSTPVCPEDEYATICECEDVLNAEEEEEDTRNWWQRFIDAVMPYLTDMRNLANRITPIVAMVIAIINLVRMFS